MSEWKISQKITAPGSKRQEEIIAAILQNRGVKPEQEEAFFNPPAVGEITPAMVGIDEEELVKAVKAIRAVGKEKEILIWGDYDADGIIGTAILWEALWQAGYNCLPFIPHRESGYGIKPASLQPVLADHSDLSLVITVDNGIVAFAGLKMLAENNISAIITDHHLASDKKPPAAAIVWSKKVCGAVVAWFLAQRFNQKKEETLDLLALATVTDMMPLVESNRSFVKYGLKHLGKTSRPGLKELLQRANLVDKSLSTYHLGFILGPRINAMGRLESAMESLRLLCSKKKARVKKLAARLEQVNRRRQQLTDKAVEAAKKKIDADKKLLFVVLPDVHPGVVGLVAGKLLEKFYRPTVVVSQTGDLFRASCRSPRGFDIVTALREFEQDLVEVGGHAQAAGFGIAEEKLATFKKELEDYAAEKLSDDLLQPVLKADCQVNFSDLTFDLEEQLHQMAPFGLGNPRPRFYTTNVLIKKIRRVGRDKSHLKLVLDDLGTPEEEAALGQTNSWDTIGFGLGYQGENFKVGDKIDIIYNLTVNEWQGQRNLQLQIKDLRRHEEEN